MTGRIVKAALVVGTALLVTACGGDAEPTGGTSGATGDGGGKTGSQSAAKKAPMAQPGTLTVAFCNPMTSANGRKAYGLTLRSLSAKDGSLVAERSIVMPDSTEPTAVCKGGNGSYGGGMAFNKDFTIVAGTSTAGSGPKRAASFDLTTGQELAPPDPEAFAKGQESEAAAFHPVTGRLWYGLNGMVASRDPKADVATEEVVPSTKIPDLLKKDGPTATTVLATDSNSHRVAAPAGGIVATGNALGGVKLSRSTSEGGRAADFFLADIETEGLTESDHRCAPSFWRDATTLICEFKQITFSADYKKVVKSEDLIPDSDRFNEPPVLSADGKSFAFLSRAGAGQWSLFRGEFTPGAQPVKIADVAEPAGASKDQLESLIRWN